MRLPFLQCCVSCVMGVLLACGLGFGVLGLFRCACMLVLRVIVFSV